MIPDSLGFDGLERIIDILINSKPLWVLLLLASFPLTKGLFHVLAAIFKGTDPPPIRFALAAELLLIAVLIVILGAKVYRREIPVWIAFVLLVIFLVISWILLVLAGEALKALAGQPDDAPHSNTEPDGSGGNGNSK